MKRHSLSAIGVAVLVVLAGTAAFASATTADGQQQVTDTSADVFNRQDAEDATVQTNVTIETVELRNVTVTNVTVNHVHVTGDVTASGETVLETGNGTETVENITAQRLHVANATLENVSFSNLTVRNESLATALLGNRTTDGDGRNVASATLENQTIDGLVIEHGNLGDATIGQVQFRSTDAMATESDEPAQGDTAMEIYSVSVEDATLGDVSAVGFSSGNETAANATTKEGDGS